MASAPLNIPIAVDLQDYVEARVESGAFGTPSEYIRELILDDRDRRLSRLEDRLLENLKSKPIAFSHEELGQGNFVELCRAKLRDAQ